MSSGAVCQGSNDGKTRLTRGVSRRDRCQTRFLC